MAFERHEINGPERGEAFGDSRKIQNNRAFIPEVIVEHHRHLIFDRISALIREVREIFEDPI